MDLDIVLESILLDFSRLRKRSESIPVIPVTPASCMISFV